MEVKQAEKGFDKPVKSTRWVATNQYSPSSPISIFVWLWQIYKKRSVTRLAVIDNTPQ